MPLSYFLRIGFNIILPSMPRYYKWSPSLKCTHQNPVCIYLVSHTCYMPRPPHSSWFHHPIIFGKEYRAQSSSICSVLHSRVMLFHFDTNSFLSTLFSNTPSAYVPSSMWDTKFHTHIKHICPVKTKIPSFPVPVSTTKQFSVPSAHAREAYKGSRGTPPLILKFGTRRSEWSTSRPGHFIPGKKTLLPTNWG